MRISNISAASGFNNTQSETKIATVNTADQTNTNNETVSPQRQTYLDFLERTKILKENMQAIREDYPMNDLREYDDPDEKKAASKENFINRMYRHMAIHAAMAGNLDDFEDNMPEINF